MDRKYVEPRYLQGTDKNLLALKSLIKHKSKNPADVWNIQKSYYLTAVEWAPEKLSGWLNVGRFPHLSKHQNWYLLPSPPEVQGPSDLPQKRKKKSHLRHRGHIHMAQLSVMWRGTNRSPAPLEQHPAHTNKPCDSAWLISCGRPLC